MGHTYRAPLERHQLKLTGYKHRAPLEHSQPKRFLNRLSGKADLSIRVAVMNWPATQVPSFIGPSASRRAEPLPVIGCAEERPDDGVVIAVAVQLSFPKGPAAGVGLAPQVIEIAPANKLVVVVGMRRVAGQQP
jgi:hypothetical protein